MGTTDQAPRYREIERLGAGGMATVTLAEDTLLGREVALKRVYSTGDPQGALRLKREALVGASLNHPNLVAVYDAETQDDGDVVIVMEYVEGQTLRDVLQQGGRLTQRRAVEIVIDMCAALEYSHRAGIVHRDIKPGNAMISREGAVKVMDFGIARAVAESTSTVTQTAAVMGTAQYLSPEQARGDKVDARSDVYSTGVLLYELLTGRPPFRGDSPVAVAYQHVREDPTPPSDLEPDLGPQVDAVVMKALAKNPANRYQSAAEMSDDLGRLASGRRVLATPLLREPAPRVSRPPAAHQQSRRRARRLLVLSLLGLLAVGAIVGGLLLARDQNSSGSKVAVPPVQGMSLAAAQKLIQQSGLAIGQETAQESTLARGIVLSSDPPQGTKLSKNAPVALAYSTGPGPVRIPVDIIGKKQPDAQKELRDLGLASRVVPVADSSKEIGTVANTDPRPGLMVDSQAAVSVELDVVNNQTTVPPVVGLDLSAAQGQFFAADLQVSVVQTPSTAPNGQVLRQDIAGGLGATRGTVVTLTVSHFVAPPAPTPPPPTPAPTRRPTPAPTHKPSPAPSPKPSASPSASPSP
jgi:serine/threonine-protein kinase